MKKKNSLRDVVFIILAAALSVGMCVYAFAAGGTQDDPLVTLGYIEGPYKQSLRQAVMDDIDEQFFADLRTQIEGEIRDNISDIVGSSEFVVLELSKGDKVECEGTMEIVLRAGFASAYVTLQSNINSKVGLSDMTAGKEILNGNALTANHHIIISRGDGRGVVVTSDKCWFLARGNYSVIKAGE